MRIAGRFLAFCGSGDATHLGMARRNWRANLRGDSILEQSMIAQRWVFCAGLVHSVDRLGLLPGCGLWFAWRDTCAARGVPSRSSRSWCPPASIASRRPPGRQIRRKTCRREARCTRSPREKALPGIVHHYLPLTRFMTGSELEQAIRSANPEIKGLWPKPGSRS